MRRQLGLVAVAISSMIALAFVIPLGLVIRSQTEDRALAQLQATTQSVAASLATAGVAAGQDMQLAELVEVILTSLGAGDAVSVFLPDGTVVGKPASQSSNVQRAMSGAAFTFRTHEGAEVLVPVSFGITRRAVVRGFTAEADLRTGVRVAWAILATLGLCLVAVAVAVADRLVRSITGPIRSLAEAARGFAGGDLDVRIKPSGPAEVVEVAESFNQVADRLDALLEAERESVADLSHRLRTPLAVLRLQAESMPDSLDLQTLLADVASLERAVSRLIYEARSRGRLTGPSTTDVGEVVLTRAAFWSVLAEDQDRAMKVDVSPLALEVNMEPEELTAMVDTLIENVFTHTEPGVGMSLRLGYESDHVVLSVEDEGPGISPYAIERGASGAGSTGLGLDIVRRMSERAGGRLEVKDLARGARVAVYLPLAQVVPPMDSFRTS